MRGRDGRIDVREGDFLEGLEELEELEALEDLERLERLEELERLDARRRTMAKHERKSNNIARYARMRTIQEFYVFCCHKCHKNSITHYVITAYTNFRNNIPRYHTFTLLLTPQTSPKHHPQNNFSTSHPKQPVTFHKTTRCFL